MKTRKYVEIFYDPYRCNWDAVIDQELKRRGLRNGQVTVICRPFKHAAGEGCDESRQIERLIDESNLHKKVAQVSAPTGRL